MLLAPGSCCQLDDCLSALRSFPGSTQICVKLARLDREALPNALVESHRHASEGERAVFRRATPGAVVTGEAVRMNHYSALASSIRRLKTLCQENKHIRRLEESIRLEMKLNQT